MKYDVIVIGSGPGGYVAAIRAAQLKMNVAVVEKAELGGVCLNWGCIPTKALLKSAKVYDLVRHAADYGVSLDGEAGVNLEKMVERSRSVAEGMSKGVQYLFKKNKIEIIEGSGRLKKKGVVEVDKDGEKKEFSADHIILATGARASELPKVKIDGEKVISYRQAMILRKQPGSMIVIGSGAIGSEFAHFFNSIGTKVTLVEFLPAVVPNEDGEVSKQLERSFKKSGMKVLTSSSVESVDTGGDKCIAHIKTKKGMEEIEADIVLSAVGVRPNTEDIGLEENEVKTEKGKIIVDDYYRTNIEGVYAIGDIVHGPALAHVASAEAIICVEKIAGLEVEALDYNNVPACTYTSPEVASVGYTEEAAREKGYEIKVGKFPFTASGKASAEGAREGFVKLIFDAKYGELLGAHMIGAGVTEMISEIVVARKLETTAHEIIKSVHPHPTMSEAVMEAAAAAYDEVIHI
ncbi:MAG: dihydrolipoyl dehydrogenase [Bacteroidales bacterium]|jgi:dihydrolipoamide dehydrogenase|nr:dihydrolipoyl dehydrogenase [Bacteroidales bacterium]